MIKYTVLFFLLLLASHARAAGLPQFRIDRQDSFKKMNLVDVPNLESLLEDELAYPKGSLPQVFLFDLNGDGSCEILMQSHRNLCGSGGCLYILMDGKSSKRIGDLFGDPVVVLQSKKGQPFPDLQTYTHSGAGAGILETFRYSNGKYRSASSIKLSGKRQHDYVDETRRIPIRKSQ